MRLKALALRLLLLSACGGPLAPTPLPEEPEPPPHVSVGPVDWSKYAPACLVACEDTTILAAEDDAQTNR